LWLVPYSQEWVYWEDSNGMTPLHVAVDLKQPDLAKTCIAKGADVNHKDGQGWYVNLIIPPFFPSFSLFPFYFHLHFHLRFSLCFPLSVFLFFSPLFSPLFSSFSPLSFPPSLTILAGLHCTSQLTEEISRFASFSFKLVMLP
jgi:Ankyrin repeats (many copies)